MQIIKFIKKILPYFYLALFLLTTALIIIKSAETGEISATQSNNLAEFLKENVIGMDKIGVHPNDNTASVYLKTEDVLNIIREHGNALEIVSFA